MRIFWAKLSYICYCHLTFRFTMELYLETLWSHGIFYFKYSGLYILRYNLLFWIKMSNSFIKFHTMTEKPDKSDISRHCSEAMLHIFHIPSEMRMGLKCRPHWSQVPYPLFEGKTFTFFIHSKYHHCPTILLPVIT